MVKGRRWICDPAVPSPNSSPGHQMDLCFVVPDSLPPRLVNSQLATVCDTCRLQTVDFFTKILYSISITNS